MTSSDGPVAAFELRLARAATLFVRSNLSVAAISRDCGFANPYYFSRRFRRSYGQPQRQGCSTSATRSGGAT